MSHTEKPTAYTINQDSASFYRHRYILWFGAYGDTRILVWENSLQDALDACLDEIEDRWPGLLCDDAVKEAYDEAIAEGKTQEEAWEISEMDTTTGGNTGLHINSWEWGMIAEDPNRATIKEFTLVDIATVPKKVKEVKNIE